MCHNSTHYVDTGSFRSAEQTECLRHFALFRTILSEHSFCTDYFYLYIGYWWKLLLLAGFLVAMHVCGGSVLQEMCSWDLPSSPLFCSISTQKKKKIFFKCFWSALSNHLIYWCIDTLTLCLFNCIHKKCRSISNITWASTIYTIYII